MTSPSSTSSPSNSASKHLVEVHFQFHILIYGMEVPLLGRNSVSPSMEALT
jgi:hypothetical protein